MVEAQINDMKKDEYKNVEAYKGIYIKFEGCMEVSSKIDAEESEWIGYDYQKIVEVVNPSIEKWIHVERGSYQGEWFSLGYRNEKVYFIQGDFGSCSYCDWLESISNMGEAKEFVSTMQKLVPVGRTRAEVLIFLDKELTNLVWAGDELENLLIQFMQSDWLARVPEYI